MAEGPTDDTLPIRCPGCGQRFKVGPDLMNRMVECGTCEHRFRVNDDAIVRSKRHYPGDRKDAGLGNFSRIPMAASLNQTTFQQPTPMVPPPPRGSGPTSPQRLLCGALATGVVLVSTLLLFSSGSPGGMMDGADQTKRLALAGFGSVVAAVLIAMANPQARGKALAFSALLAGGLFAIPFFVKAPVNTSASSTPRDELSSLLIQNESQVATPEDPLAELKAEMGYQALEKAMTGGPSSTGKAVMGVWLRDLKEYHKAQVGNYIVRAMDADEKGSHLYPRPPDYLMVLMGVDDDISALKEVCERFGEVRRVLPELHVVEVVPKNDAFQEGPLDKLIDTKNPSFYELNRRELESIDLERSKNAVQRLTGVEPKSYRPDIVHRMQQLLKEGSRDMQGKIATALETWSQDGDGSLEAVRTAAEKIRAEKAEMPEPMIEFLAKRHDMAALPMVDELWVSDPTMWETAYADLGPGVEDTLLKRYPESSPTLKMSATRILGRVGTTKSIPVLEASRSNVTGEIRSLIDSAVASIRARAK